MRITFLCGSFEPGRDGVADYLRRLAAEVGAAGHRCQIVAVADRFATTVVASVVDDIAVLRLPFADWLAGRTQPAEAALAEFAPDWVSLQMVGYSYADRGVLPRRAARAFARLGSGRRRHTMFHELWLGEPRGASIKERFVGALQRRALLGTHVVWAPTVVHTSNPLYRALLRKNGVEAELLPLHGNIPVRALDAAAARRALLERIGIAAARGERVVLAGVFGSVHAEWHDAAWLEQWHSECARAGSEPFLIHLGRAGAVGRQVLVGLQDRFAGKIAFAELGELEADDVSAVLRGLDYGVATTPWPLVGKSGTVAAMLEHGLPVVVTRRDYVLRAGRTPDPTPTPLLLRFDAAIAACMATGRLGKTAPRPNANVATTLLAALERG